MSIRISSWICSGVCLAAVLLVCCADQPKARELSSPKKEEAKGSSGGIRVEGFSAKGTRGEPVTFQPTERRISFLFFLNPVSDCSVCYAEFFRQIGAVLQERRREGPAFVILASPPTDVFLNILPDAFRDSQATVMIDDRDSRISRAFGVVTTPYVVASDSSRRVLLAAGVSAVEAQQRIWGELLTSVYALR